MKIALSSVIVDNPNEAFKFYTEVLGFIKKMHIPEANLAIVVSPEEPDGTALLLEPNDNPIGKTFQEALHKQGLPAIVLGVKDVQSEYARLKNRGILFSQAPKKTEWGIQAVFDDTCGNWIQIHQG